MLEGDFEAVEKFVKDNSDYGPLICAVERIKKELAVGQKPTTNKPSAKPCSWCLGRVANKGVFSNYCPLCGFDLRTASHVGNR